MEDSLHMVGNLAASVVALVVGPAMLWFSRSREAVLAGLRGFVQVTVVGMVALEVLPSAVELAGLWAVAALVLGYLLPGIFARGFGTKRATWAPLLLMAGLTIHALVDGLALAGAHGAGDVHVHAGHGLEAAIILHRLPVGLAVVWMLRSRGVGVSALGITILAVATVLGGWLGGTVVEVLGAKGQGVLAALVGGLLAHVIRGESLAGRGAPRHAGYGALIGLVGVAGLVAPGWTDEASGVRREIVSTFADLFVESAPALLLAYVLAGALGGVIGEASMRWLRRGGGPTRAMKGMIFGLPLPLCSCGVVPVYQSLIRRGTPAAAAVSFLVATPELGIDAVLISLPMLGPEIAIARVLAAAVVALGVGWIVGGWIDRSSQAPAPSAPSEQQATRAPLSARLRSGLKTGFVDIVDDSATWILVGLAIAAVLSPFLRPEAFAQISPWLQVPLFALIGAPIYVCATGATPLAAILVAKGASPGAALAFLLTGPATNATTFGVLERLHGRRAALVFMGAVVSLVVCFGIATDLVLGNEFTPAAATNAHMGHTGTLELASAGILAMLFASSLVRQGPGGFVGQLGKLAQRRGHDHDHDHDHEDGGDSSSDTDGGGSCCASSC